MFLQFYVSPYCSWVALVLFIVLLSNFTRADDLTPSLPLSWHIRFSCMAVRTKVSFWDDFFQIKLENGHLLAPCPVWMAAVGTVMPSIELLRNSLCADAYFLETNESKKFKLCASLDLPWESCALWYVPSPFPLKHYEKLVWFSIADCVSPSDAIKISPISTFHWGNFSTVLPI